jgi:hypothetical protein
MSMGNPPMVVIPAELIPEELTGSIGLLLTGGWKSILCKKVK